MPNLVPRKKEDRRKDVSPASVLGGFLRKDRRKNGERRKNRSEAR
jgi:hypothetical protein